MKRRGRGTGTVNLVHSSVLLVLFGEVAERPNAGALKAPEGKLSGGSNPSLAAIGD